MPKLIKSEFGKIEKILDKDTNEAYTSDNWRNFYIDKQSLICIYESQNKAPGKKFIRANLSLNGEWIKHITTSLGELEMSEDGCKLTTKNSIYFFKFGDFGLSELDKIELKLSVLGKSSLNDDELQILAKYNWFKDYKTW